MSRLINSRVYLLGFIGFACACGDMGSSPTPTSQDPWAGWSSEISMDFERPRVDALWVISNASSMCQEQKSLRANFDSFVDVFKDTTKDLQIAVTTTHTAGARPLGQLHHVPDPIPSPRCLNGLDAPQQIAALSAAYDAALGCVDPAQQSALSQPTEAQWSCALSTDPASCGLTDRNADGALSFADLFPTTSQYRALPKVLRVDDYRQQDGSLDVSSLKRDFGCMSLVGTRGDGFERGLQAAIKAISPELTGLTPGAQGADPSKPNHGFVRQGATQHFYFVTDGGDCSSLGDTSAPSSACAQRWCGDNPARPLTTPEDLANTLISALTMSLGGQPPNSPVFASVHGQSDPQLVKPAQCEQLGLDAIEKASASCESQLSSAMSGERYERFIRQFPQYYPNDVSYGAPLDFTKFETGWICTSNFAPVFRAIAGEFAAPYRCPNVPAERIALRLSPSHDAQGQLHPYCEPDTPAAQSSCAISLNYYSPSACIEGGMGITWAEPLFKSQLDGHIVDLMVRAQ